MGTFFTIIIVSSPIWATLFVAFVACHFEKRQYNKIKFKEFKKFYELNPKRWRCETNYVICQIQSEYDYEVFMFNFFDECKYRLWRRSRDKQDTNKQHAKSTQRMLDAVKEDIAKAKEQETANSMDEFIKQLIIDIKDRHIEPEIPSLPELLKKYGVE